jgi:hypothetical protein
MAVAALLALLAGCGGGDDGGSKGAAKKKPVDTAAGDVRLRRGPATARIREMFKVYNEATASHDFGTACARLAPESVDAMLAELKGKGIEESSCVGGLTRIYDIVPDKQRRLLDDATRNARIRALDVNGKKAKIDWTTRVNGRRLTLTHGARMIGDEWKMVDVGNGNPR